MPAFGLITNVPGHKLPPSLTPELINVLHEILEVPRQNVTVMITPGQLLRIRKDDETAAICELVRFNITHEENIALAGGLSKVIGDALDIPHERIIIVFRENTPDKAAISGLLGSELLARQK